MAYAKCTDTMAAEATRVKEKLLTDAGVSAAAVGQQPSGGAKQQVGALAQAAAAAATSMEVEPSKEDVMEYIDRDVTVTQINKKQAYKLINKVLASTHNARKRKQLQDVKGMIGEMAGFAVKSARTSKKFIAANDHS